MKSAAVATADPRAQRRPHGRAVILASVARDSRLTRSYLMLIALSTAIAHIGLLMNSAPAVIGAMLISPLLGPLMGLGFGLAIFETGLLRRALVTLLSGVALAIAVAMLLTVLSPVRDVTPPILARVRPSLLDLFIAAFGGVAGAYAIMRKSAIAIVGVAIATALIPPLAVVGYGLATRRYDFAAGALLLFVTNTTAIALMATGFARLNGFGSSLTPRQTMVQTASIFGALALLAIPLSISLETIVREARAQGALRASLSEMAGPGARIDSLEIRFGVPARVDALVITSQLVPDLEARFAETAKATLGREVDIEITQLRADTDEAERAQAALAERFAASDARRLESRRLIAGLAAASGVPVEQIVVDRDARRVMIPVDAEQPESLGPAIEAMRAVFPEWTILRVVPEAGGAEIEAVAP